MCYTDSSVDCNYHSITPSQTSVYIIIIITSLVIAVIVLILVSLLYLIYCRHGKKPTNYVELNLDNDHHDTLTHNDHQPTIEPAQEANNLGDQLQVGLQEFSQSQCSKSTVEDSWTSKLVGFKSNLIV